MSSGVYVEVEGFRSWDIVLLLLLPDAAVSDDSLNDRGSLSVGS